jgi:hypothetical protein
MAAGVTSALASGAIAVNDGMGTAAVEADNDECKVAVSFEQCGAYVGDRVHVGAGLASFGSYLRNCGGLPTGIILFAK